MYHIAAVQQFTFLSTAETNLILSLAELSSKGPFSFPGTNSEDQIFFRHLPPDSRKIFRFISALNSSSADPWQFYPTSKLTCPIESCCIDALKDRLMNQMRLWSKLKIPENTSLADCKDAKT